MLIHEFWALIDQARNQTQSCWEQCDLLEDLLEREPSERIEQFQRHFDVLMCRAYQTELMKVAYIVNGGLGSSGFDHFRGWLISRGEAIYNEILTNPGSISSYVSSDLEASSWRILSVASNVYRRRVGGDIPIFLGAEFEKTELGCFEEENLKFEYPDLWLKFLESED